MQIDCTILMGVGAQICSDVNLILECISEALQLNEHTSLLPFAAADMSACCEAIFLLSLAVANIDQSHCSKKLSAARWPCSAACTTAHLPLLSVSMTYNIPEKIM